MHMLGEPRTMQDDPRYDDVVDDVRAFLEERVEFAVARGHRARSASWSTRASASARRSSTTSSCCAASTRSSRSGFPVVVGTSRKSFLGRLTGRDDPHDRVAGDRGDERARARARGERLPRPRRRADEAMPSRSRLLRCAPMAPDDDDDDELDDAEDYDDDEGARLRRPR